MKMPKKILWSIIFLLFLSCNNITQQEYALRSAGENRKELEKILNYYSQDPKDSLKYKAACFLIENMDSHFYFTGTQLEYKKQYYKILTETDHWGGIVADSIDKVIMSKNIEEPSFKRDIEEISFCYLIDNIEWAFKVREEQPWGKNVSFEDFCDYILPYRLGDEDITYWREYIYNKYNPLLDSIRHLPEAQDPLFASQVLFDSLRKTTIYFCNHPYYDYRVGPQLAEWFSGDCLDITDAATYIFRALGLPCSCEKMPLRGDNNVPHYWNSTMDKEGNSYYFSLAYSDTKIKPTKDYPHPKGKVYRETYSLNSAFSQPHINRASIYNQFRYPHIKDVTSEYTPIEISINFPSEKLYKQIANREVIYICQASWQKWIPVALTNFRNKQLYIPNIEVNVVYLLATFDENRINLISDPFYVDENSVIQLYTPQERMTNVVVYHKYRLDYGLRKRLEGGVFEASNARNFSNKDTLHIISERPNRLNTIVMLESEKEYRYVRYFGPEEGYCNIAEVSFFNDGVVPLKGKIIGTPNIDNKIETHDYTNVFDSDPNTSFDYYIPYGGWAGMDLEHKQIIRKLSYTARNRDNYIRRGNKYELFYFQNQTWKSAGAMIAESDSLIFNVPEQSLLYLKNHMGGVEERIFGVVDGKQRFW